MGLIERGIGVEPIEVKPGKSNARAVWSAFGQASLSQTASDQWVGGWRNEK